MRRLPAGTGPTLLATLAATALAGCSLRLETPPIAPPSPDQYERLRDQTARYEADVADALGSTESVEATPGHDFLVAYEKSATGPHLDALGGVYVPFPSVTPEPSPSAAVAPLPRGLARAAALARDADVESALVADSPALALLLASIGVSHAEALAVAAYRDAIAAGVDTPLAAERPLPLSDGTFAALVPEASGVDATTLQAIIVAHDYASYVYEVVAARSSGATRTQALERSRIHEHRADELVAIAASDPRTPAYEIDHASLAGDDAMAALARAAESSTADRYLTAFSRAAEAGEPGLADRQWLLSGAYDALVQELLWPGALPADAVPLPGVTVPGATVSGT